MPRALGLMVMSDEGMCGDGVVEMQKRRDLVIWV